MTTKISYLRDPKAPQRVLTLVSRLTSDGEKVEYAFSLNRPTRWVKGGYGTSMYADLVKGDQFSKARGRQIAEGRLADGPLVADLVGREPDVAILETLRDASDNSLIRRIAEARLSFTEQRALLKKLIASLEAQGKRMDAKIAADANTAAQ